MAGRNRASPPKIPIGNCLVEINGTDFSLKSSDKSLLISVTKGPKIRISVDESKNYLDRKSQGKISSPFEDLSFVLVNPKDADITAKSLLQDVLNIYTEQLPSMNYAANTGKKSQFLEKCISSGKYKTLILKSNRIPESSEVIAAVSYQIIPSDTQYAEIPLAAVRLNCQNNGIGHYLCDELKARLQSVGISTIFCWTDEESEGFWRKQGFVSIGEVDSKGKARRLRIKANIRKSLCYPGSSNLMVAHLKKDNVALDDFTSKSSAKSCSSSRTVSTEYVAVEGNDTSGSLSEHGKDGGSTHSQQLIVVKRKVCEGSSSSLKSKRVRGGHHTDYHNHLDQDLSSDKVTGPENRFDNGSLGNSASISLVEANRGDPTNRTREFAGHLTDIMISGANGPIIMFMNIADDAKKANLTKIIEELGGSVTCDGSVSTHVMTGKARKTLNFCIALCSGAWILSPHWLKESFREGRFLGELQFILEDEDYLLRYKCALKDAVIKARSNPNSLLRGYTFCISKYIQPSVAVLTSIIKVAGGNVTRTLNRIQDPSRTIFLACEEDMEDSVVATSKGVMTFSSDWFMTCIMKYELDLAAPQFAESL